MATVTSVCAMNLDGAKTLHPFFTKQHDRPTQSDQDDSASAKDASELETTARDKSVEAPPAVASLAPSGQQSIAHETSSTPPANDPTFAVQTPGSRKRRKLNSSRHSSPPGRPSGASASEVENGGQHAIVTEKDGKSPVITDAEHGTSATPKKPKVLKLNGKGGFNTPKKPGKSSKEEQPVVDITPPAKRRGRPPKQRSLVVILQYGGGSDDAKRAALGETIDRILSSPAAPERRPVPETGAPLLAQATNPTKPTHPFFSKAQAGKGDGEFAETSKPDVETVVDMRRPRVRSFTTPVKMSAPPPLPVDASDRPAFLSFGVKKPFVLGTKAAMWPPRGFHHHAPSHDLFDGACSVLDVQKRRSGSGKQKTEMLHPDDGIQLFRPTLSSIQAGRQDLVERIVQPRDLELPRRTIESGSTLRAQITQRLTPTRRTANYGANLGSAADLHPAVLSLRNRVGTELSTFDRAVCESRAWTAKYQPLCAAHTLQSEREISILRSWLAGLTVDAVKGVASAFAKAGDSGTERTDKTKRKRRKKKSGEFDDFIADSDDEGDLTAISEEQGRTDDVSAETQSMIRDLAPFSSHGRKMNAVLISGPHGCGKTAAVYAVARELGYEVFEINSSSRRSGKDIVDRVGDMTLNHQVRHKQQNEGEQPPSSAEAPHTPKKTLGAFFRAGQSSVVPKKRVKVQQKPEKASTQRQALVLLEEADVLFDDDKQFWESIQTLATNSRRPIILTCTDESMVPLQDLSLYAILRFRPPPVELAASYMLAMAAAECHVLAFDEVANMFRDKQSDLRASITTLQFYCQMAVGDSKGGLDWCLERWPPGIDRDSSGEVLHVVSNDTFRRDLCRPGRAGTSAAADIERLLGEGWAHFEVEPLSLVEEMGFETLQRHEGGDERANLAAVGALLDSLSTGDVLGSVDLPSSQTEHDVPDPTLPRMTEREHHDYTAGFTVLNSSGLRDYPGLCTDLRVAVATQTHATLEDELQRRIGSGVYGKDATRRVQDAIMARAGAAQAQTNAVVRAGRANKDRAAYAVGSLIDDTRLLLTPALAQDTAPYARAVAAYDLALEAHRDALAEVESGSSLASSPAAAALAAIKHQRKTRASRSALEGGQRSVTRRDRWFGKDADCKAIVETAGLGWPRGEAAHLAAQRTMAHSEPQAVDMSAESDRDTVGDEA